MAYVTTGTTPSILIEKLEGPKVSVGHGYFWLKILNAQAAFEGSVWEKVTSLVVASRISLNHPRLGSEARVALQQSRTVKRRRSEQLGLSPTLIALTPATMERVTMSVDFILDREDRLRQFAGLINSQAFVATLSLDPVALGAAKTISTLANKILDVFVPAQDKRPILQFSGDFSIIEGVTPGRYAILGSQDESQPLPRNPKLTLRGEELLSDGSSISTLSYVVFEIGTSPSRTKDLGEGAPWFNKLQEVDGIATRFKVQPFFLEDDQKRLWNDCDQLMRDAQVLIHQDERYTYEESSEIIGKAWSEASQKIYPKDRTSFGAPPLLDAETRRLLSVESIGELRLRTDEYEAKIKEAQRLLTGAGMFKTTEVP